MQSHIATKKIPTRPSARAIERTPALQPTVWIDLKLHNPKDTKEKKKITLSDSLACSMISLALTTFCVAFSLFILAFSIWVSDSVTKVLTCPSLLLRSSRRSRSVPPPEKKSREIATCQTRFPHFRKFLET